MARRTKYFYNPKSLSFEKVSDHRSYVLWRRLGATSLFVVLVVGLSFVISHFYVRFNMLPSQQNNFTVLRELETVSRQLQEFEMRLADLEDKDLNIYRSIFNVAPPKPTDFRGKDYTEISQLPNGKMLTRIKQKGLWIWVSARSVLPHPLLPPRHGFHRTHGYRSVCNS